MTYHGIYCGIALVAVIIFTVLFCIMKPNHEAPLDKVHVLVLAQQWMIDNQVTGTVSCNHEFPEYCDVVPADFRQPFSLYCYNTRNICVLSK